MVALNSTSNHESTPTPSHSFDIRSIIILSAAGFGIVVALGLFIFICCKARQNIFGSQVFGKPQIVQANSFDDEKNGLKTLYLCSKLSDIERKLSNPKITSKHSMKHSEDSDHDAPRPRPRLPHRPASSIQIHRTHRQTSITGVPMLVPSFCSPPSTSPNEIVSWIQSDTVLCSHDGYTLARSKSESRRSQLNSPNSNTSPRTQTESKPSDTSEDVHPPNRPVLSPLSQSHTVNAQPKSEFARSQSPAPSNVSYPAPVAKFLPLEGASVSSEWLPGHLEQGTRWGTVSYTLGRPVKGKCGPHAGGKENQPVPAALC